MAGIISVTPDELRSQSRVYLDARDMVAEAKGKVDAMNNQIAEQWRGEAFRAYLEQFQELATHVVSFNELLADIYHQLNNYATTIESRDYDDAKAFGINSR